MYSLCFCLLEETRKLVQFFKYFVEFTSQTIQACFLVLFVFLFQNSIRFNFFARYQPIYIVYFLLCEFWQIVSFKGLVQFIQVFKSVDVDSLIVSLYLLTSKGSLVMFPISFLVLVMFILSFFFLVWLKNYTVYPSFQRNSFALTDFLY